MRNISVGHPHPVKVEKKFNEKSVHLSTCVLFIIVFFVFILENSTNLVRGERRRRFENTFGTHRVCFY